MNRMSIGRVTKSGVTTPTDERRAAPPKVTGKGQVKKSAPHKRVRIPASLG